MRILFLDTKPNNPNRYLSRAMYQAFRHHPAVQDVVWASYVNAIDLALDQRFDVFFAFGGEEANNAVVLQLCSLIPKRAIWFTEDPYETYRNTVVAKEFDFVFSNDAASVWRYGTGAAHLPLAADRSSQFFNITADRPLYDLFFAGTAWPNRLEFLSQLKKAVPHVRMKTILVSNPAIDPYISHYREEFEFSSGVSIGDFCRIANRSLLTLTLPRKFSTDSDRPTVASDTPGPRLFEIALAGSCQLVDAETNPYVETLFDEDKHFLSFRSVEECAHKLETALEHPENVASIARAAQNHCLDRHLYAHRCDEIVRILASRSPSERHPAKVKRPNVLFITHNVVEQGTFGGAEIYLDTIQKNARSFESLVLTAHHDNVTYRLLSGSGLELEKFRLDEDFTLGDLTNIQLEQSLQRILGQHAIDVVHINHLVRFPPSILHIIQASGSKIVFSLHDYHSICDVHTLIGFEGHYCDIPNRAAETCDICLQRTRGWPAGSQAKRRRFLREGFRHLDKVLVGSEASANIFREMFPDNAENIVLLPPPAAPTFIERTPDHDDEKLHVALLGNFTSVKGAETAISVFRKCKDLPVAFHIFGRVDAQYTEALAKFEDCVVTHGEFPPGQFPIELGECQIFLLLSPWPETYCMSLSEAQWLGLVPIVTDLGAQAERVEHGVNGYRVAANDAEAVTGVLRNLSSDRTLVQKLADALPATPGLTNDQFMSELSGIYSTLTKTRASLRSLDSIPRYFSLDELNIALVSQRWLPVVPAPTYGSVPGVAGVMPSVRIADGLERRLSIWSRPVLGLAARQISRGQYALYLFKRAGLGFRKEGVAQTVRQIANWFSRRLSKR